MSWTIALLLAGGFAALLGGAELLVRGAARLAAAFGISPLVVGLTVVAFGTSAPELAVSTRAALAGQADIAFGNVVGSNIFNVLFILGLSALIAPLAVDRKLVRLDVPIMIGVSVLFLLLGLDGRIGRLEGTALVILGLVFTAFQIVGGRKSGNGDPVSGMPSGGGRTPLLISGVLVVAGLGLLVLGSRWLVDGAVALARAYGTSELVIGLTIIAVGTSLPEVATSVIASLRGERDIAVGNVIGSNIFNVLWVLGLAAAVSGDGVALAGGALGFDALVMLAAAVACLPIFITGYRIDRWEGALFLGYYVVYVVVVLMAASRGGVLESSRLAILFFFIPLAAVTLGVIAQNSLRRMRRK